MQGISSMWKYGYTLQRSRSLISPPSLLKFYLYFALLIFPQIIYEFLQEKEIVRLHNTYTIRTYLRALYSSLPLSFLLIYHHRLRFPACELPFSSAFPPWSPQQLTAGALEADGRRLTPFQGGRCPRISVVSARVLPIVPLSIICSLIGLSKLELEGHGSGAQARSKRA